MPLTLLVRPHHSHNNPPVDVHVATAVHASMQGLDNNLASTQCYLSHWIGWRDHGGSFPHHLVVMRLGRSTREGWIQYRDWVVVFYHRKQRSYLLQIGRKRYRMQR